MRISMTERVLASPLRFALMLALILGIFLGCSDSEPTVMEVVQDKEWYCKPIDMKLRVTSNRAHFINNEGQVIIQQMTKETDTSWYTLAKDSSSFNLKKALLITIIGDEVHVGSELPSDLSGVYRRTNPEIVFPIDLDGKNKIDINVEVIPGEKPIVTIEDKGD